MASAQVTRGQSQVRPGPGQFGLAVVPICCSRAGRCSNRGRRRKHAARDGAAPPATPYYPGSLLYTTLYVGAVAFMPHAGTVPPAAPGIAPPSRPLTRAPPSPRSARARRRLPHRVPRLCATASLCHGCPWPSDARACTATPCASPPLFRGRHTASPPSRRARARHRPRVRCLPLPRAPRLCTYADVTALTPHARGAARCLGRHASSPPTTAGARRLHAAGVGTHMPPLPPPFVLNFAMKKPIGKKSAAVKKPAKKPRGAAQV